MRQRWAWIAALMVTSLAAVAFAGCGDDDDSPATKPPATATTSPTKPQEQPTTPETTTATTPTAVPGRTGNAALDRIVDLVKAGDTTALASAIQFHEIACTVTPSGVGSPPLCLAGESAGTKVKVFINVACEFEYVRPAQVQAVLDPFLKNSKPQLYAAFKLKDDASPPAFPLGTHALLFSIDPATGTSSAAIGTTADGQVTSFYRGCGFDAKTIYERLLGSEVLVAPPAQ